MNNPARYDGRGYEPPYITVTDIDEAERNAVERSAVVAETFSFSMDVDKWREMTKKELVEHVCKMIADSIRNQ